MQWRLGPPVRSGSTNSSIGIPSGVDSTVQRIGWLFDVRGLVEHITSYSSAIIGQGVVVNDVQRVYNSFEQPVTEYQEHNGAVNTSTSVNVQYTYADGSANTIRPTAIFYPNGRQLNLSYGTAGGIDDALSRVASLIDSDGVTHLADYTRIGADTFVMQSSPQPQIAWSLINGTGIDPYTGLDQFDRIADNLWFSTATSADLDRIQHGYDRASGSRWRRSPPSAILVLGVWPRTRPAPRSRFRCSNRPCSGVARGRPRLAAVTPPDGTPDWLKLAVAARTEDETMKQWSFRTMMAVVKPRGVGL
jgi:hypothetical protein